MISLQLSPDPKPIGAFIEYTLKPLIDDSRELIELLEKHKLVGRDVLEKAIKLYIFHSVVNFLTSIIVTGLICYTALRILGCRPMPA